MKDKMVNGQWFKDNDPWLVQQRTKAANASIEYNGTRVDNPGRDEILRDLLKHFGKGSGIGTGVQFFYGCFTSIGDNCYINYNAILLDGAEITIGDNCLIGPNSAFLTISHPMYAPERIIQEEGYMYQQAKPITIEKDVWMGGNVTVLPGVTVGEGSVIGAGTVVNRDIPPYSLVVGNPAKIIRKITEEDRLGLEL